MSAAEEMHRKLDLILEGQRLAKLREDDRDAAIAAHTQAIGLAADTLGTLVIEVNELRLAAEKEPGTDLGKALRELSAAVERNTNAVLALVARRGATHQ